MSSTTFRIAVTSAALAVSGCAADIHPTVSPEVVASQMAELWEQPSDLPTRDLLNGPWGVEYAPNANDTYTFLRKKRQGANPGMTVHDSQDREWHIKQGVEAQPEVVLSHVLSALGYHQPPVYYLPSFALADETGSHPETGGRFRLHDSTLKDRGEWSWDQNPFVGTAPYQGLLVILVMFNSADLKNENNSLYQVRHQREGPENWFVVRDLGSSLGEVGRFNPKENRPDVFERQAFINGVRDGFVSFAYHGVHSNLVQHRIRPADVRWASQLLAQLTEGQWQDAFRGAGYPPPVASRFINRLHQKIDEGRRLGPETAQ
jgi:hypothetical protein